ncbi:MAG TPA: hypothetical protein VF360_08120 [Candidatus Methanoperedens sp.]
MNVEISEKAEKDFKKFVLEKHGKLRGKLSEELEKAIMYYLADQEKTDPQDIAGLKEAANTLSL